jgi:flagellar hook assembly protein FlgD
MDVEITIYNILGRKIKTIDKGNLAPGVYSALWDGTDQRGNYVSTGTYFFDIVNGIEKHTKNRLYSNKSARFNFSRPREWESKLPD